MLINFKRPSEASKRLVETYTISNNWYFDELDIAIDTGGYPVSK